MSRRQPAAESAIEVAPAVRTALEAGRPVVALETAVLTHGLPRPVNLETVQAMEQALRDEGAEPATVAVLDGRLRVGLEPADLVRLAEDDRAAKCATRDLPSLLASGRPGGTTVSATAYAAHTAGIPILATGGIGGVHRGAPFDVSADLIELGRRPITVVCSGAKSLLDLPATLEVLESRGVPVLGYGCDRMPAFYAPDSGLPVTERLDDPASVAARIRARDALGLPAALLLTVPVPPEHAIPLDGVEALVAEATAEAAGRSITGAAVTPYILSRLAEISGGRSLAANRALLVNNARVAARIAAELSG